MVEEKFTEIIKNITVWKSGTQRAPNKPLLLLLALRRVLDNLPRLIPYSEVDEELGKLLRNFGPRRSSYHPDYPFWRLQNDGIWEVRDSDKIRVNSAGDARKKDLLQHNVPGGLSEEAFSYFLNNKQKVYVLIQGILDSNFPATIHEDIVQAVGVELPVVSHRKRDPSFREKVLRAYGYKCAVCGFDVRMDCYPIALEAAHIKWRQAGGPDAGDNGIALCSMHHKLFDRGAFTVSERFEVLVSDRAHGSGGFEDWLMRFHGRRMSEPNKQCFYPDLKFIDWHVCEVFQGDYRE